MAERGSIHGSSPREIPGFYYDREKGKYFKILPNHVAPAGAKHSQQAARLAKAEEAAQKIRKLDPRYTERKGVQRLSLNPPELRYHLEREIGRRCESLCHPSSIPAVWAKGIRLEGVDGWRRPEREIAIKALARDEVTGTTVQAIWNPAISEGYVIYPRYGRRTSKKETVAIRMNPYTRTLTEVRADGKLLFHTFLPLPGHNLYRIKDVRVYQTPQTATPCSTNALAISPFPANSLAIATTAGMLAVAETETGLQVEQHRTPSHMLAVAALTPNVFVGGCRDGAVLLYDTRTHGHALRLRHASSVVSLRCPDPHRIVAAGLHSKLDMYDLRACGPVGHEGKATRSYLAYEGYKNMDHPGLGFDVSASLGLVAAASSDGKLRLFELWTGKEVEAGWGPNKRWEDYGYSGDSTFRPRLPMSPWPVRVVEFVGSAGSQEAGRWNPAALLVVVGSTFEEWKWEGA